MSSMQEPTPATPISYATPTYAASPIWAAGMILAVALGFVIAGGCFLVGVGMTTGLLFNVGVPTGMTSVAREFFTWLLGVCAAICFSAALFLFIVGTKRLMNV